MKTRATILIVLLAGVLSAFHFADKRDRFQEVKESFLDFLIANAREKIEVLHKDSSKEVVLVKFDEKDKEEYSAWPPAPLDYIIAMKRLQQHDPEVLVIVEPLRWDTADQAFVPQLRQTMLPFPSIAIGFDISSEGAGMNVECGDFISHEMSVLKSADISKNQVPFFNRITKVADKSLRIATESGFSKLSPPPEKAKPNLVPFVAYDGHHLIPSLAAQAVTLFRHVPYAAQRINFGAGAHLSLGGEHIVPLDPSGRLKLDQKISVPTLNALDLMSPDIGDAESKRVKELLGKKKIVLVSLSGLGEQHAKAIAQALAFPLLTRKPYFWDWIAASLAIMTGMWQLRYRRIGVLVVGLSFGFASLIVSLIAFQSSLEWWFPMASLAAIGTSTLFCFIWPVSEVRDIAVVEPEPSA